MSTVPSGTRFIGISERVNLTERKSAVLNSDTQPFTIQDIADTVGVGAQGPQGVQGPAGPLGPVGPAGLNWQGAWVSGTSYVADDAVGYGGASYFCILATSGTTTPDLDTTNWALLASQGAQGIQGVQGPTGPQGASGANVTKVVKITLTPLQVQSLFTTPIKVIQGVSGKGIMPIQILVLSNNQVAGYSPSGGLLQLKHEGSNPVILSSNTGLGSFGDTEAYGLSVSSLTRGFFTTNGVSVFANLSTANPVGGDGGLILHIVYNEITF